MKGLGFAVEKNASAVGEWSNVKGALKKRIIQNK